MQNLSTQKREMPINGLEQDCIYARNTYCYTANNPSIVKWVKRQINKRGRRKAKLKLRES